MNIFNARIDMRYFRKHKYSNFKLSQECLFELAVSCQEQDNCGKLLAKVIENYICTCGSKVYMKCMLLKQ